MALLLRADNLRVFFGIHTLFNIKTIEIHEGDRIGLVGDNGVGKSTLLSVLYGEKLPDEGAVDRAAKAAMVRQFGIAETVEAMDEAIRGRLSAKRAVHEGISGGEMERLRIARALSTGAPLLFADEPTTNLDFDGLAQATQVLSQHRGALVLVSHDRALLDALCTSIWALEAGELRVFPGNYTVYRRQKERERDFQRFEYDQYRKEQVRLRSAIVGVKDSAQSVRKAPKRMGNSEARLHKRGGGTTAKARLERQANALQTRLQNLDVKERPREESQIKMTFRDRESVASAAAVRITNLHLQAGGRTLLGNTTTTLRTGKRTVLVGPNGCGKTTLLRAIRAQEQGVQISPGVTIGWFGQETLDTLDLSRTLLENVMAESVLPVHETRTILARMGLTARDMEKPAPVLSGGERAKTALARLIASGATLLLLDELGNHLDLNALEALEDMLAAYEGTLLLVSHDRHMIDRVAQQLWLFENNGLTVFDGNLTALMESRAAKQKPDDGLGIDILQMRMAALLSRMSHPKKGDRPEMLEAEYEAMAAELRQLRRGGQ